MSGVTSNHRIAFAIYMAAATSASACVTELQTDPAGTSDSSLCAPGAKNASSSLFDAVFDDARALVEIYEHDTCTLFAEVGSPTPKLDKDFGASLALSEPVPGDDTDHQGVLWVGVPKREYTTYKSFLGIFQLKQKHLGVVRGMQLDHLDETWGREFAIINNPIVKKDTGFGQSLGAGSQLLAIGSPGNGRVYLYNWGVGLNSIRMNAHADARGPQDFEGTSDAQTWLENGAPNFGKTIDMSTLPTVDLGGGRERRHARLVVGSDRGSTCYDFTAETSTPPAPGQCQTPPPVGDEPPPPPPEGCEPPGPITDWTVTSC